MPISGRDSSFYGDANNLASGTGMSNNPVFKVNIRSLDTQNEQPANQQQKNSQEEIKFSLGEIVTGQSLESSGKTYTGKIVNIKKNSQNGISYLEILDSKTAKKVKLNSETCSKVDAHNVKSNKNDLETQAKFPFSAESNKYVMSFDEFINS